MKRLEFLNHLRCMGMFMLAPGNKISVFEDILARKIPSTGESLPVVGLGTWQTFDVGESAPDRKVLSEVLNTLITKGGKVIDSSPMYGSSEKVVGDLSTATGINEKLFIATKVWTTGKDSGIRQMNDSLRLLKRAKIDLMQIHNLTDWETHLKTLKAWKDEGRIRYIGLTHYLDSVHDKLISIIAKEKIDFIQVNYNLLDRHAENKLLPYARDHNVAVLINRPFEEGSLFQKVKGKELPEWSKEIDCKTWGQFFLKFIISHPAVTCVIPGTSKPHHMLDNLNAGFGKLPSQKMRENMAKLIMNRP